MIHVSNIGEIIDIQCKKDVKKVEFSSFLFGGGREIKLHPQPLPEEGGEGLAVEIEGVILGLIRGGNIVTNEE